MTTPTGTISASDVATELSIALSNITLDATTIRTLAGKTGSGTTISMNDLRGKSNAPARVALAVTISTNTTSLSLSPAGVGISGAGYVAGQTDFTITIAPGVYVYAVADFTNNTTKALLPAAITVTGWAAGDTVTIVNQGYIMGLGGGASRYDPTTGYPNNNGQNGGNAIETNFPLTINNTYANAYIGGGGGAASGVYGGGGAGGGSAASNTPASAAPGSSSAAVVADYLTVYGYGAGGGRVFPGATTSPAGQVSWSPGPSGGGALGGYTASSTNGNAPASSAGGAGDGHTYSTTDSKAGTTSYSFYADGGGGGWGAAGGQTYISSVSVAANASGVGSATVLPGYGGGPGQAGGNGSVISSTIGTWTAVGTPGLGGKAVALNGNTVTWVAGNTTRVYGAVA